MDIGNDQRARHAKAALSSYLAVAGGHNNSPEEQIQDLLCDILHLADSLGIHADVVIRKGIAGYREELTYGPRAQRLGTSASQQAM